MKDKLILMTIVLITMISCNQTGNDNAKKAAYRVLKENELKSGVKKDTIILGYIFGMSSSEVKSHTNKLIKDEQIKKESDKLIYEMQLGNKSVPFSFQTNTYNDRLNFFRAETSGLNARSLNDYLNEIYGDCQYVDMDDLDILKMTTYNRIKGNREIKATQITGAYTKTVLIFDDQSNQEPIDISTSDYSSVKIENSAWDSSVLQVKQYLKENLKDPKSYEGIEWSEVQKYGDTYKVRHKYRAKNSYGGYVIENQVFTLNKKGEVINVQDF